GKLTRVFDHDQLEALARQTGFVQRSTSKLTGTAFVELMTTDMLDEAAVSLDGLCDLLQQRHPQATMPPKRCPSASSPRKPARMCTKCCNWRSVRISWPWAPSCR